MTRAAQSRAAGRDRLRQLGLAPIGLDEAEAAAYVGVSGGTFRTMVDDGRMPKPRAIGARNVWHRAEIDEAFTRLPTEADGAIEPAIDGGRWEARA